MKGNSNICFIRIPSWIMQDTNEKKLTVDRLGVFCHLYRNLTKEGYAYFIYKEYADSHNKIERGQRQWLLQKAKEVLEAFEKSGYITKTGEFQGGIKYRLSNNAMLKWTPFIILTIHEYDTILQNAEMHKLNINILIKILCAIKQNINRTSDDFPLNVCMCSTEVLSNKINVNEITCRKYLKALSEIGLIERRTIHLKTKEEQYLSSTITIPVSEDNHQEKMNAAINFLKNRRAEL